MESILGLIDARPRSSPLEGVSRYPRSASGIRPVATPTARVVAVGVPSDHACRSGLFAFLVRFSLPADRSFLRPAFESGSLGRDERASFVQRLAPLPALIAPAATCSNTFIPSRLRVPPSPFRPNLDQLNQERRIGSTKILLRVGHVSSGTTELAQLVVRHFARAFADSSSLPGRF